MVFRPNLFMDFYTKKMNSYKHKAIEFPEQYNGYTAM